MHGEHLTEQARVGGHGADGAAAQVAVRAHQEHEPRHELGAFADAAVFGLVEAQIVRRQGAGQRHGLLKQKAEAFAGDGVDRSRGVAHQRHAPAADGFQAARSGDAAAFQRGGSGGGHAARHFGKLRQSILQAQARVARNQHHADLGWVDGRDVKLTIVAPVDFHDRGGRVHAVMAAEAVAAAVAQAGIEASPVAHGRLAAIGPHNPARTHQAAIGDDAVFGQSRDASAPGQADAGGLGAGDHEAVQRGAAESQAVAPREGGFHGGFALSKTDAAEGDAAGQVEVDAQRARGGHAVRHNALAASFVDGRNGTIRERDIETAAARGDGGGQSGGTAADHEDFSGIGKGRH